MTPIPGPMRPRADETVLRSISQRVLWLSCAIVDAKSIPKRFASSVNERASSSRAAGRPWQVEHSALGECAAFRCGRVLVQREGVHPGLRQEAAYRGHDSGLVPAPDEEPAEVGIVK